MLPSLEIFIFLILGYCISQDGLGYAAETNDPVTLSTSYPQRFLAHSTCPSLFGGGFFTCHLHAGDQADGAPSF